MGCNIDPLCEQPKETQELKTSVDWLILKWKEDEESKKHYRKKQDESHEMITLMYRDVRGDEALGVLPLRKEITDIKNVMYIPRMFDAFWNNVKSPLSWVILIIVGLSLWLGIEQYMK